MSQNGRNDISGTDPSKQQIQDEQQHGDVPNDCIEPLFEGNLRDTIPRSRIQTTLIMLALSLAIFLAALDAVIITTALPTITRDITTTDSGFAWIGASYLLANAAGVPFWGKTSDIFGRKPLLLAANVVFAAGSLICAVSRNLAVLVAGRAVQGFGAGGVMALVNILVGDLFSPRERGVYFGVVGAVWGLASGVGPLLGGGLTERVSWRWCFWINLPVTGLSLLLLVIFLRISTPRTPLVKGLLAIDWLGMVTFTAATLMFLVGLELGGSTGRSWTSLLVLCLILLGIAMYLLFALTQVKFAQNPVMPPRLFADRSIAAVYVATFFHGLVFSGLAFFLPLYFQVVLGASPIDSGIWLLATAVPLAFCAVGVGITIRVFGRYVEIVRTAMALSVLSMGLFTTLTTERAWARLLSFQVVAAVGIAPNLQALLIGLQALVREGDLATGTATFAFVRNASIGIGVIVGQVLFQGVLDRKLHSLTDLGVKQDLIESLGKGAVLVSTRSEKVGMDLSGDQMNSLKHMMTESLSSLWLFFCAAAGAGLISTLFIKQVVMSRDRVEVKTGLDAEESRGKTNA